MRLFWTSLVNFFFPPRCPFCGQMVAEIPLHQPCPSCLTRLVFFCSPKCPKCGLSFRAEEGPDHLCSKCLKVEESFTIARALGPYDGLLAEVITRFKYCGAIYLANSLGMLLANFTDDNFSFADFDLIVPVPLHPRRLRERGFNQALLLARVISQVHKIPLDFVLLERVRYTAPQTQLSGADRQKNVRGAFRVRSRPFLAEKNILLIDDVFTSGATVAECALVLKQAGVRQVAVLTLARAV